ncbi:uncharacterized protein [Procambarus clarkii]|uniref:uncharacterized protein isoform X2 n=1 Tax=Procambarus clarkii TaxID=6728 RepID=UPI003742C7D4
MECVNYKIPEAIPPEYANITLASSSFYKLVNILDQLEGEESMKKHTIIATSLGHLIELQEEKVLRSVKLTTKDVAKIVVHHEFRPLQLYIVLLYSTHRAVILSYNDFKILHEWDNISDISSEDAQATGFAHLKLSRLTGEVETVSSSRLMTLSGPDDTLQEEGQKGKSDAVEALARRLKGGIRYVGKLNSQRRMKENFIAQKLVTLQSQLQGLHDSDENNLMAVLTIDGNGDEESREKQITTPKLQESCLKILNVRHKIVHGRWVIGLNVLNDAERVLVCSPQLIIQVTTGASVLSHTSHILKIVQRRNSKAAEERDGPVLNTKVSIEKLEPPVLRPKKRACVLGVSFSSVALIAGSICNSVTFTSLVSPLTEFISRVSKSYNLVKVCGVSDLYCFYPNQCHPLSHAAFTYLPVDTHKVDLKIYSNDEKQALLVVHSILAVLPNDANIQPSTINLQDFDTNNEKIRHQLLAKMKEATSYVVDGYKAQMNLHKMHKGAADDIKIIDQSRVSQVNNQTKVGSKNVRGGPQEAIQINNEKYMNEREDILARKGDVTFDAQVYCLWRKKLHEIQCEMDNLYVKYLE